MVAPLLAEVPNREIPMYVMLAMTVLSMIATVVLKVNYKEKIKEGEKSQILSSKFFYYTNQYSLLLRFGMELHSNKYFN